MLIYQGVRGKHDITQNKLVAKMTGRFTWYMLPGITFFVPSICRFKILLSICLAVSKTPSHQFNLTDYVSGYRISRYPKKIQHLNPIDHPKNGRFFVGCRFFLNLSFPKSTPQVTRQKFPLCQVTGALGGCKKSYGAEASQISAGLVLS